MSREPAAALDINAVDDQRRARRGPLDKFLRPRPQPAPVDNDHGDWSDQQQQQQQQQLAADRQQQLAKRQRRDCAPYAALKHTNLAAQLLGQELGWRSAASLNSWRQAQRRQRVVTLQLPQGGWQQHWGQDVCCLELQAGSSSGSGSGSGCAGDTLAAVGLGGGALHLARLSELLCAAEEAVNAAAAAAEAPGVAEAAGAAGGGCSRPATVLPPSCLRTFDLHDRLLSACWAPAGSRPPELATAGPQLGVKVRRFAEGRHHEYPLQLRGGQPVARAGQVRYLGSGAPYTLAAATPGGVLLWDCRLSSRAAAELPALACPQLLRPLPGGELLLAATADGQLSLYDLRRLSSAASSSVVTLGGGRAAQQLVAAYNLPARAAEEAAAAAAAANGSLAASSGAAAAAASAAAALPHTHQLPMLCPFLRDLAVNPADCNLVAFVRPDLQVGVLDLCQNRVLQQVCVTEALGGPPPSEDRGGGGAPAGRQRQAPGRCCWDAEGRVLHTHGLLRHTDDGGGAWLRPTLASVDFGSWAGSRLRRQSSWPAAAAAAAIAAAASSAAQSEGASEGNDCGTGDVDGISCSDGEGVSWARCSGGGLVCRGGQVVHLPLRASAPTELAVCGRDGRLLAGTLAGGVVCAW